MNGDGKFPDADPFLKSFWEEPDHPLLFQKAGVKSFSSENVEVLFIYI